VTELVQPLLAPPISVDGQPINETQLIDLINKAQTENPGGVVVTETNLTDFFRRGGKLLHYMGGADPLVPTNSSLDYYGKVNHTSPEYVDESYLYYEIPVTLWGRTRNGQFRPSRSGDYGSRRCLPEQLIRRRT